MWGKKCHLHYEKYEAEGVIKSPITNWEWENECLDVYLLPVWLSEYN